MSKNKVPENLMRKGATETPLETTAEMLSETPADVGNLSSSQYEAFACETDKSKAQRGGS